MRMKFFVVPALDPVQAEADLDRFLAAHRIVRIDRQLVTDRTGTFWVMAVEYTERASTEPAPGKKPRRIDYKEVLSEEDFRVYAALRELRKTIAEREAVPAYTIFNNAQLAEIVQGRLRTLKDLGSVGGVGPSRIESYGAIFFERLKELQESEESAPEES